MKTLIWHDEDGNDDGGGDEPPDPPGGGSEEPPEPPEVGRQVIILDGPFADFEGIVDNINQEKGKVRINISFFGRKTPVEVPFSWVKEQDEGSNEN